MGWVALASELIYLNAEAHRKNEKLQPYLNFSQMHRATLPVLNVAGVVGWLILFTRNLNLYDPIVESVTEVLKHEMKEGSFSFDLGSILIFFLVLWIASLIASVISFLVGGEARQISSIKKSKFGNVILIIRLAVLSLGFLVAIAAAGIPLDKITIIIGALGVGIGFGLQNIVNNLVSGIILAFEKPVSVGDQIEVGGRLGKVKEIGIRSSKLATFEGAEVIIPNGDLLSQHLVNWTLSNNHRRVEINVGVKYGVDLNRVQEVLKKMLEENEKVDRYPAPLVLVDKFNNSSIDFRLLIWTDIAGWVELKSEIIMRINEAFLREGIEIPYPQQDVHIKSLPARADSAEPQQ
jgi:small-conductance mechanosensitive channel